MTLAGPRPASGWARYRMVIYGCGTFKFRDRSCNLVVVGSARFAHQAGTSNITPPMHYRCPKYVTHSIATVCALSTSLMWAFGRVRGLDGGVCVCVCIRQPQQRVRFPSKYFRFDYCLRVHTKPRPYSCKLRSVFVHI